MAETLTPPKPLGRKAYGHIGHLPGSRLGPSDHRVHDGQARICTERVRDKHDRIIVQEKLDGSCVAVARVGDAIVPLIRAGYRAEQSRHEQHRLFARWSYEHWPLFYRRLRDGERFVGEWLAQAHGTRYALPHEPFVVFDLMREDERATVEELAERLDGAFTMPRLIHAGGPISVAAVLASLEPSGHGALDPVEGAVWRVERYDVRRKRWTVDFLAKYVRPDKVDGRYLPERAGAEAVWNWRPAQNADIGTSEG